MLEAIIIFLIAHSTLREFCFFMNVKMFFPLSSTVSQSLFKFMSIKVSDAM